MPEDRNTFSIEEREQETLIGHMVEELPALRAKLGISQVELAGLVGVSRQTYSAIETKRRRMTWNTFLSLVLIFDSNVQTHDYMRKAKLFPHAIIKNAEPYEMRRFLTSFTQMSNDEIIGRFDEQAIHAIKTVIMVEYARCNNITGEAVVKAFGGKCLSDISVQDEKVRKALGNIKMAYGVKQHE